MFYWAKAGSGRWSALVLVAILAVAAHVRFTVALQSEVEVPILSDASDYFSYAYNLKHFGVYSYQVTWAGEMPPGGLRPDSLRTPGYPLFLRGIPGLDTSSAFLRRVGLVQSTLGVVAVLLFHLVARRLLRPGWSHAATALVAVSPHLANLSTYLLSESLFHFLLTASTLASLAALDRAQNWRFVVAGVLWGLCALVRPTVLGLPPLFLAAACLWPAMRQWRMQALLLCVAFVAVQSPWLVRNRVVELDASPGGLLLASIHHGSYPGFLFEGRPETYGRPYRADPASVVAERDLPGLLQDLARKFRAHPVAQLRWYLVGKPGTLFSWSYVQGRDIYVYEPLRSPYQDRPAFRAMRALSLWMHWPLVLGGVLGAFLAWWRPAWLGLEGRGLLTARVLAAIVLYIIAFHVVMAPFPRYGVPFRPFVYALGLALAQALAWTWKGKTPARAGVSTGDAGN